MRAGAHHIFGRSGGHQLASAIAAFGAQVDDPVGLGDQVEVVLDHQHAVAAVHQAVQYVDQLFDVLHVQAHCGFVQHVKRVRRLLAAAAHVVPHLAKFGDKLDALRLTTAQRWTGLAEREVAEAHVLQELQWVRDGGHRRKEIHRFIDFHLQHISDAFAAPCHSQRLGVEARAVADLARHLHVGQKAHADGAHALAFARRAAAFAGVEAETPWAIASRLGFQRVGKQLAHGVPKADVGGGAGARRLADGGLVDFEYAVDRFKPAQTGAANQRRRLARVHGVAPGLGGALADPRGHIGQQHIARQR